MGSNKVFISYAHVDKVKCDRVCELLQQYHVEYWKDENGIAPSAEDFNEAIENAIRDCRYFITVWTSGIKNSDYCKQELELAFELCKRDPNNREVYILQMEEALDQLSDLPPGCRILANGRNFLFAYDDAHLKDSIVRIATQVENKLQSGIGITEFRSEIRKFVDLIGSNNQTDEVSLLISDSSQNDSDYTAVVNELKDGKNVFVHGERGIGKTNLVRKVYSTLLVSLNQDLTEGKEDLFVPVYADLEVLWEWDRVVYNNVLYKVCDSCKVPYCVDRSVHYIILLDGEMRTSRGYLPEAIDLLLDDRSGTYSLLIAQTELQVLTGFSSYSIKALSFPGVVNYTVKRIANKVDTARFFRRLFVKAFSQSAIEFSEQNGYFNEIRKIYKVFEYEEKNSPCNGIRTEDFYSLTLAKSTQKGRLPKSLTDENEIDIWRKLIIGNEVFRAIRIPYYLNWLIDLYQNDNSLVFPYRLKTLQVKICHTIVDRIDLDPILKDRIVRSFLIPLANFLKSKMNGNYPISISSFKENVRSTDFERTKKELVDAQIINVTNKDIVFRYDFLYDYFLNYADPTNADRFEDRIRICPAHEWPSLFISYIKLDEPYKETHIDAIEIATDIVKEERDYFNTTEQERRTIISIAKDKLNNSSDYVKRASILNGIAKLFGSLDLSVGNDYLDVDISGFWYKLSDDCHISRFPITCFQYDDFVEKGYNILSYWKYGKESLKLKDGNYRRKPLKVDSDMPVFHISNHPIVGVTWYESVAFCEWLSERLDGRYDVRLPYIYEIEQFLDLNGCKYYNSPSSVLFHSTSPITTFYEGTEKPVDIIGNVWEWSCNTEEFYGDVLVKCYGGCWNSSVDKDHLLTTYPAKLSSNNVGFRVVLEKHLSDDK